MNTPSAAHDDTTLSPPDRARPARLAGSWYEADPVALRAQLEGWLADAAREPTVAPAHLLGIIAPHAGYRFSGRVAASAYRLVRAAAPQRVFVLGPSHYAALRGVALVEAARFDTPLGPLTIDTAALTALARSPLFIHGSAAAAADAREHSVEMQMPWVRLVAPAASVVPLIVGRLTLPEVAKVAEHLRALLRPGDLVIASSDFTHYGPRYRYTPFGAGDTQAQIEAQDRRAWGLMAALDLEGLWRFKADTEATICGFAPISILLALLPPDTTATLARYDTSGHLTGDLTNSVSYVAGAFASERPWEPPAPREPNTQTTGTYERPASPFGGQDLLTPSEQRAAVTLARRALEAFVLRGETLDPHAAGLAPPGRLTEPHGVFVTLDDKATGRLRGCIGDLSGRRPLAEGIVANAINAAAHDPRFRPVRPDELPHLSVEVTVLSPPHPVASAADILIGRDGIVLSKGARRAVYLPQVPIEQGWGLRRTLEHLARKAGLSPADLDDASYQTFRGYVYEESE